MFGFVFDAARYTLAVDDAIPRFVTRLARVCGVGALHQRIQYIVENKTTTTVGVLRPNLGNIVVGCVRALPATVCDNIGRNMIVFFILFFFWKNKSILRENTTTPPL